MFTFFHEIHTLGDIAQKLKIMRKFRCFLATTTQRTQVFGSCKFGFIFLAEVQITC
jgi:hypothetical protein